MQQTLIGTQENLLSEVSYLARKVCADDRTREAVNLVSQAGQATRESRGSCKTLISSIVDSCRVRSLRPFL